MKTSQSTTQRLKQDLWRNSIKRRQGTFEDPNTPVPQSADPLKEYLYQQGPGMQAKVVLPEEEIQRMQTQHQGLQQPYEYQLSQTKQIGQNSLSAAIARRQYAEEDQRRKEAAEQLYQQRIGQINANAMASSMGNSGYNGDPNAPWQLPLQNFTVTARYGQKGKMWQTSHGGIDLAAPTGTAVRPVRGGTVTRVENHPAFGNVVWVDNGNGITTRYGHLSQFGAFKAGQQIGLSDILGYVGQTGNASGPHLHLGFYNNQGQTMNPEDYIGYLLNG